MVSADPIRVVDEEMGDVPRDGSTIGEVVMRGNNVMKGYFDDPEATDNAFRGGWFHSGDLGVWHADGYIELRDRAKDIIISGGEHLDHRGGAGPGDPPRRPRGRRGFGARRLLGRAPRAFVVLKSGAAVTEDDLIGHVRQLIAKFKAPDQVEFLAALPEDLDRKIQKYVLRDKEWAGRTSRVN